MNKKQLDTLSSSLSKAINPTARKIEATAKILEHIEPLPVVFKQPHDTDPRTPSKCVRLSPTQSRGALWGARRPLLLWKTPWPK